MIEKRIATLSGVGLDLEMSNIESDLADHQSYLMELKGWYGGVGVEASAAQRPLGHGLFREAARRKGRALTIETQMKFKNEQLRTIADRFLSGQLWDGDYGKLKVTTGDRYTLTSTVRLDGDIDHSYIGQYGLKVQIPLMASDPFLYAEQQVFQVYPEGAGVGIRYPLFADPAAPGVVSYGKANPNTQGVVQNLGNATAYPEIRLVGDFPSGFILKDSRNRTIEYPFPVWEQSPATVNSAQGAIYQNGLDQSYKLTRREWYSIPAGGTEFFRVASLQPGDGRAEIIHRDTYI